jgi:hypothetical protein
MQLCYNAVHSSAACAQEKRLRAELRRRSFWDADVRRLRAALQVGLGASARPAAAAHAYLIALQMALSCLQCHTSWRGGRAATLLVLRQREAALLAVHRVGCPDGSPAPRQGEAQLPACAADQLLRECIPAPAPTRMCWGEDECLTRPAQGTYEALLFAEYDFAAANEVGHTNSVTVRSPLAQRSRAC